MSYHSPLVSADLIWQIAGHQNSYLVKRNTHGGVRLSSDPLNVSNISSRKHAGFANDKAVGVAPGENGGVVLVTKKPGQNQKPASQFIKTPIGAKKNTRSTYKSIASTTSKSGYRPDIRAETISRASAIRKSQRPVKEAPESKPRGAKAKAAAAKTEA